MDKEKQAVFLFLFFFSWLMYMYLFVQMFRLYQISQKSIVFPSVSIFSDVEMKTIHLRPG